VSLPELQAQLKAAQARDSKMSVAIKGESGAQYAKVVAIIDLCDQLHVNMGIVTSRIGR
jgi:biopolymer transport protein ExbD